MEEHDPNMENNEGGEQNPTGEEAQNEEQHENLNAEGEGEGEEEQQGDNEGEGEHDHEEGENEEGEEVEDDENEEGQEIEDSQDIGISQEGSQKGEGNESQNKEKDSQNISNSSKALNDESKVASQENLEDEDLGESNEDDGEDEGLPPERKVRYRLFKFINKMRAECHINPYKIDLIANNLAMLYADYLLNNKENEEELNNMAKALNFRGEFKVSSLDSFIDSDGGKPDTTPMAKYMEFADDFYDVQATLIEFEEHCDNILSENFNKVGIGMALNDMKVVVVNIFCKREVTVDSCSINAENGNILIKGELNDEQYGAYALRVVSPIAPTKTIVQITPQHITPANIANKIRPFTAIFNNIGRLLEDPETKNIEIYIRVKPDMIPYNKIFSDKIRFEDLTLGAIIPLMNFPNDKERKEEKRQDAKDEKVAKDNLTLLADYERRKDEEKKRRMKIDGYAYANKGEMDEIQEENDEDVDTSKEESSVNKSSKQFESKAKSQNEMSDEYNVSAEKSENYERELQDLETANEKLKEDNEIIQKKINVIYEFRKKEGREERNFYKESNINESTYADSLTSTAGLYNDLNSHKTKLDQDLKRYQQSIEEQEKINYKEYLAQLGKVETNQIERIKKYLEEQIQQDEALKALYRPEKINACYDFIMGAVKEMPRKGNCAFVDDGIIFKMARDYFIEILPKVADEPPEVKSETTAAMPEAEEGGNESVENGAAETEQTVTESSPAENENAVKTDEYGFEVFGEEPETKDEAGAETAEEAETEAETEPEAVTENIEETTAKADNENSGTPREEAEPENEKPQASKTRYDEEGQGLFDF